MPSLPPAICRTTRMVPSLPVAVWMAESAAWPCSAVNVLARNAGTVHDSALPNTVLRKNSRRVWSVISFFIFLGGINAAIQLCDLICGCGHHQANDCLDVCVSQLSARIQKLTQRVLLVIVQ